MREPTHPKQGRRRGPGRILVLGAILGVVVALLGLTALASAQGQGGNQPCPAGTTQVAKFDFPVADGTTDGPVTIVTSTATEGTFTSTVLIGAIVVKGGSDNQPDTVAAKIITFNPPVLQGAFDNSGLLNNGGNVPDISNLKFCSAPLSPETPGGGGAAAQPVPGQAQFTG